MKRCGEYVVFARTWAELFAPKHPACVAKFCAHEPLAGDGHDGVAGNHIVVARAGEPPVYVHTRMAEAEMKTGDVAFVSGQWLLGPWRIGGAFLHVKNVRLNVITRSKSSEKIALIGRRENADECDADGLAHKLRGAGRTLHWRRAKLRTRRRAACEDFARALEQKVPREDAGSGSQQCGGESKC